MKTNKRRRFILFFMFLLFPITIFYFSPIYSIWDAILGGISGSVIVFGALFIASIFVGRAPCGWIMPCGGLQESCFYINNSTFAPDFLAARLRIQHL